MSTEPRYKARFHRDIRRIRDRALSGSIERVIEELKVAASITEVRNVRKIAGWEHYYRIRVGSHRLGLELVGNAVILERFGHRRDFYRYFP